jgi:hypothetical protein
MNNRLRFLFLFSGFIIGVFQDVSAQIISLGNPAPGITYNTLMQKESASQGIIDNVQTNKTYAGQVEAKYINPAHPDSIVPDINNDGKDHNYMITTTVSQGQVDGYYTKIHVIAGTSANANDLFQGVFTIDSSIYPTGCYLGRDGNTFYIKIQIKQPPEGTIYTGVSFEDIGGNITSVVNSSGQ